MSANTFICCFFALLFVAMFCLYWYLYDSCGHGLLTEALRAHGGFNAVYGVDGVSGLKQFW